MAIKSNAIRHCARGEDSARHCQHHNQSKVQLNSKAPGTMARLAPVPHKLFIMGHIYHSDHFHSFTEIDDRCGAIANEVRPSATVQCVYDTVA